MQDVLPGATEILRLNHIGWYSDVLESLVTQERLGGSQPHRDSLLVRRLRAHCLHELTVGHVAGDFDVEIKGHNRNIFAMQLFESANSIQRRPVPRDIKPLNFGMRHEHLPAHFVGPRNLVEVFKVNDLDALAIAFVNHLFSRQIAQPSSIEGGPVVDKANLCSFAVLEKLSQKDPS